MQWAGIEEKCQKCIHFSNHTKTNTDYCTGGIINNGTWGWIANGIHLQILSLESGENISTYDFEEFFSNDARIVCIEDIKLYEDIILAIFLQNSIDSPGGALDLQPNGGNSILALYSISKSCTLTSISLKVRVTCARFIEHDYLGYFFEYIDGCLAIADAQGGVMLLNLNLKNLWHKHKNKKLCEKVRRHFCHILDYNMPVIDLQQNLQRCNYEEIYYAIELPAVQEQPTTICSILAIPAIEGLAVGLEDGRLVFYDLLKLRLISIFTPQPHHRNMPIVKLCFLLPLDDPRPSLYVWAVHQNDKKITAVMHGLFYDKYLTRSDGSSSLKDFRKSNICLELPLESMAHSELTSCQAISLASVHSDEDTGTLCMFSWYAKNADKNKILLFDLNQWYKDEMPLFSSEKYTNFTMVLTLNDCAKEQCLDVYLNPNTISLYNSVQRAEEHFYPNALSFSLIILQITNCRIFNWEGSQNRLIQIFQNSNAAIFLEIDKYFNKILQANLLPQLINASLFNTTTVVSLEKKYDVLLSVALENNCYNLLRDCVHSWSDGSFSGNLGPTTGLSLSVITEWIWRTATNLEKRCTYLCNGLLENNGYDIDQREQRELGSLTRQLKLLYNLMDEIISNTKRKIPEEVNNSLQKNMKSLQANTFYYRVVLWLFNIGLLPATNYSSTPASPSDATGFVYNFMELELLYKRRRKFFAKLCKDSILKRSKSCRLIYIDAFIEHECRNSDLYELWSENNNGNGTYPPRSFGDMLRMLLLPNIEFNSKCIILMYFFLDLHIMLEPFKSYKKIEEQFVKFPSVFQLPPSLMKTVQTFWFIDRGCFSPIVDEYISLINKNLTQSEWLMELLMEILLLQLKPELALRVLQARPGIISPKMKLKALIANDLITEAFHMARSDNTEPILELFFNYCIETGRYGVVRDLTLNEREGHLLQRLLNRSKVFCAENLHFVYLLSRSKYIEAIAYMDELSKRKDLRNSQHSNNNNNTIETSQLVLSAFNTTIAPMQQGLTDTYFRIHNKIKQKDVLNQNDPVPLSCQLIKQNANNLLGGIYHSSALSAHFATYNYDVEVQRKTKKLQDKKTNLFVPNNMPFLRKPQVENITKDFKDKNSVSIPQLYRVPNKRQLDENHELYKVENAIADYNPPKRLRLLEHKVIDVDFMQNYRKLTQTNHDNIDTDKTLIPAKEEVKTQGILKRQLNQSIQESPVRQKYIKKDRYMSKNNINVDSINSNTSNQLEDFQTSQNSNNSCALNDAAESIKSHSSSAKQVIINNVESPKPRKPLNRKANIKDFECMQQNTIVPKLVVCNADLSIESPQHKLPSIGKEVQVAVVIEEDINKIDEFKPQVSSSKVCESQSKFDQNEKTTTNTIKYTECSTIIGTMSYDDEISTENVKKISKTTTAISLNNEFSRKAMLETTMDMTSWEEGFLLERDAAINLQEENQAKGHGTEEENKEVYFTALSSNWHNKDSGLSSTLNSKKSQMAENNENCNLYDFSEVLGPNEEASIILSLEDSDLACIQVNKSLGTSCVDAKETHDINESSHFSLVDGIINENCAKDEQNTEEIAASVSDERITSDDMEIKEISFYQSFYDEKCTSDNSSENDCQKEENQEEVEEEHNVEEKEKEKKENHDNSIVVITIDESDSSISKHIESDVENQHVTEEHEEEFPDIENEQEKVASNMENKIKTTMTCLVSESENENLESYLIKMPVLLTDDLEKGLSRRRTAKRGISVPPQTTSVSANSPASYVMERALRHRATSLQPLIEHDEYNKYTDLPESPKVGKGRARRGSSLHEAVNLSPIVGSPYQNTRSRMRLNSEESENDISIVSQTTRSRRQSVTSETNENDVLKRPLRKRKLSTSNSIASTDSESNDNIVPVATNSSKTVLKQRRLTRQQLKAFEKSLNKNLDNIDAEIVPDSPTSTRRLRTRSTQSLEREIDDDEARSEKSVASSTRSKRSAKSKVAAHKPLSVIIEDEAQSVTTTPKSRSMNSKK